eukprot:s3082_g4.t1
MSWRGRRSFLPAVMLRLVLAALTPKHYCAERPAEEPQPKRQTLEASEASEAAVEAQPEAAKDSEMEAVEEK